MVDKEHTGPNDQAVKKLAVDLIDGQSTMTLATAQAQLAWAAPVYYVFSNSCFYFFSDPTSRHMVECLASGQAASAIYASGSSWQEIRGIQMSGSVKAISVGFEAIEVKRRHGGPHPEHCDPGKLPRCPAAEPSADYFLGCRLQIFSWVATWMIIQHFF